MIHQHPSPNFVERTEGAKTSLLVMHYTGMESAEAALERMCDPEAEVSAHYMIDEDGRITQLVDESNRAWHCGISCWRGRTSLNDESIGIELVNPGHALGYREFSEKQMGALIELSKDIVLRHKLEARNVVGHSDIAPARKEDPGELFDWQALAEEGIGIWPHVGPMLVPHKVLLSPGDESSDVAYVQSSLADYGYHIRVDGFFGPRMEEVVIAFKRHFVQDLVGSSWDKKSHKTLESLNKIIA